MSGRREKKKPSGKTPPILIIFLVILIGGGLLGLYLWEQAGLKRDALWATGRDDPLAERLKIYYNGRLQAENLIVQPIDVRSAFTLGDSGAQGVLTAFDNVQVFGRELTAEEIAAVAAE